MIVCKPPIGSRFECVYFILREDRPQSEDKNAMMKEIEHMLAEGERKKKGKAPNAHSTHPIRHALALFFGGMACGALPLALLRIFA